MPDITHPVPVFDWLELTSGSGEPLSGTWVLQAVAGPPRPGDTAGGVGGLAFLEREQGLVVPFTSVRLAHQSGWSDQARMPTTR